MSNDKREKVQNQPTVETNKDVTIRGEYNRWQNSDESVREGYQPTDKLNITNPPIDNDPQNSK